MYLSFMMTFSILLKIGDEETQLDFDNSMVYLDEYIKEISTIKDFAPIFIKMIWIVKGLVFDHLTCRTAVQIELQITLGLENADYIFNFLAKKYKDNFVCLNRTCNIFPTLIEI